VADDQVQPAAWLDSIGDVIGLLIELDNGTLAVGGDGLTIAGEVATEQARDSIADAFETFASGRGLLFTDRLGVFVAAEPTLAAAGDGGRMTLMGVVGSDAERVVLEDAAADAYGAANVTSDVTVADRAAEATWVEGAAEVLRLASGAEPWSLAIDSDRIVFSGRAEDRAALEALEAALGDLGDGLAGEVDLQLAASAIAGELTELLEGSATFQTGSTVLSDEATALLDDAIAILVANPATSLIVQGHTDDVGDESANLTLSQARAEAVVAYLIAGGVEAERLTAVGFGETRPIADNATAEGRAQNRRIEFVVQQGDDL
jgi:OOP family OmpA-OmpF porin